MRRAKGFYMNFRNLMPLNLAQNLPTSVLVSGYNNCTLKLSSNCTLLVFYSDFPYAPLPWEHGEVEQLQGTVDHSASWMATCRGPAAANLYSLLLPWVNCHPAHIRVYIKQQQITATDEIYGMAPTKEQDYGCV